MIEHIILMVISFKQHYTGWLLQSGQPINRIPLGFGTTDLNGDGASFSDAYQGNSDRFPGEQKQ
jgi:hypothetical protein